MKTKVFFILIAVFNLLGSVSSYAAEGATDKFQIKHLTAGSIEKHLQLKNADERVALIAESLSADKAIHEFSDFLVDICLNPKKYNFDGGNGDATQCEPSTVHHTIVREVAEGLVFDYRGKKDAIHIERHLNDFMNNYLEKVRAVIEAFENWM